MRRFSGIIMVMAMVMGAPAAYAQDHYEFDKSHTHVIFLINHLGYSKMMGLFTKYDGSLRFDPEHPQDSALEVTLYPSGIQTSSDILDHVLQGENFFNASKYPEIHFASTGIRVTGKQTGDVTGNLTMLGQTHPLTLHVTLNKVGYQPVTNLYVAGFSATADLKRSDFGMNYGIPMVGDDVHVEIETETVDSDRKNAEKIKH